MTCSHCQREIPEESNYCPACGSAQTTVPRRRLARSRSNRMIAGVCAGIADYFGLDVTLVRLGWAVLSIVPGAVIGGVLAYVLAWLVLPEPLEPGAADDVRARPTRLSRSATNRKIAGVCGGLGEYFGVDPTAVRLLWLILSILPGAVVGGLVTYIVAWLVMPRPSEILPVTSALEMTPPAI
jgi:phage shock protein C